MKRVQVLRNLPMPDHSSYAHYERVTKIPKSHFQFLIILCFRSFLSYQKEKKEKKTYQLRLSTNGNVPNSFCRRKRDSELNNVVLKFIR
ncbi:unnamed protein product [Brassica rapa]|uniref:Uncharacterized protein n=2 Tax=Brassica TaxID=3705 RepID=A0A8D9GDN9_BRACM|nr:unnamed protein product [Brassica napus]CAG7877261.1 unnamed protein product [Brassica rapa]